MRTISTYICAAAVITVSISLGGCGGSERAVTAKSDQPSTRTQMVRRGSKTRHNGERQRGRNTETTFDDEHEEGEENEDNKEQVTYPLNTVDGKGLNPVSVGGRLKNTGQADPASSEPRLLEAAIELYASVWSSKRGSTDEEMKRLSAAEIRIRDLNINETQDWEDASASLTQDTLVRKHLNAMCDGDGYKVLELEPVCKSRTERGEFALKLKNIIGPASAPLNKAGMRKIRLAKPPAIIPKKLVVTPPAVVPGTTNTAGTHDGFVVQAIPTDLFDEEENPRDSPNTDVITQQPVLLGNQQVAGVPQVVMAIPVHPLAANAQGITPVTPQTTTPVVAVTAFEKQLRKAIKLLGREWSSKPATTDEEKERIRDAENRVKDLKINEFDEWKDTSSLKLDDLVWKQLDALCGETVTKKGLEAPCHGKTSRTTFSLQLKNIIGAASVSLISTVAPKKASNPSISTVAPKKASNPSISTVAPKKASNPSISTVVPQDPPVIMAPTVSKVGRVSVNDHIHKMSGGAATNTRVGFFGKGAIK